MPFLLFSGVCPSERLDLRNSTGWIGAIEQGTALPLSDGGEFSIDADRGYAGPPLRVTAKTVDGSPRNPFEKADYAKYQLELKRQEELLGRN